MKLKSFVFISLTTIFLAGCSLFPNELTSPSSPTPSPTSPPTSTPVPTALPSFTLDQIATHASPPDDCWLVIENKVYDVSNFGAKHPGKDAIYQGCGKDATVFFNTRPMGSKTPHSENARSLMVQFEIGTLSP